MKNHKNRFKTTKH